MNTLKNNETNLINNWLDEYGSKEIEKLVSRNVSISNRVIKILAEKNISRVEFAELLGKSPSEVTKLLSGRQNINIKTIVKMEIALEQDIIAICDEASQVKTNHVYFTVFKNTSFHEDFTPTKVEDSNNKIAIAL